MVVILFAGSGAEIMPLCGFVRVKRCRDINVRFWTAFRPLEGDLDGIPGRLGRMVRGMLIRDGTFGASFSGCCRGRKRSGPVRQKRAGGWLFW